MKAPSRLVPIAALVVLLGSWPAARVQWAPPVPKDKIRVFLVTGGHDHDVAFYSAFLGQKDLEVTVDGHPSAFAGPFGLLRTDHPLSDGPVAWTLPHAKARLAYIQLGHGREAHEHPTWQRLVHQAIRWAAAR